MAEGFDEQFPVLYEQLVGGGVTEWDAKAKPGAKKAKPAKSPATPASPQTPTTPLTPTTLADRSKAAGDIANLVKVDKSRLHFVYEKLRAAGCQASSTARYGGLLGFKALAVAVGQPAEPYLISFLPIVLERVSDKVNNVKQTATELGNLIVANSSPYAIRHVVQALFTGLSSSQAWQTKQYSLNLISSLQRTGQLGSCLPEIVPVVSEAMWDTKDEVKAAATKALTEACQSVGNPDIEPFVPVLVKALANPEEIPECVYKLAATTFVQAVESPTLAILVPLLVRGLKERTTAIKRQASVIIDNMAKLVNEPESALVFLDKLVPGLENVQETVSDPECRTVAAKSAATLNKIREAAAVSKSKADPLESIREFANGKLPAGHLEYVAIIGAQLNLRRVFEELEWEAAIAPYLSIFMTAEESAEVIKKFFNRCGPLQIDEEEDKDDEEGEDLCNCEFSLAYGSKILLNTAKLHLKRGKRYGLCGPNDVGKSTLMKSIAGGQLEGFPPPDVLRSVYVEPDIPAILADLSVIEFVYADPKLKDLPREEVEGVMKGVGFTDAMLTAPVTSLSGGWRMKCALSRAILAKADILMLDEPTNHLDKHNVKWLQDYLCSLKTVTTIAVSHDSTFLDTVCTDIIHFEPNKKLKRYKGNLSEFVKYKPEAKSYYELVSTRLTFKFPEPGYLEGVKSKAKVILKMVNVGFTYPGTTRKILTGVSIWCSLSSRVAVLGVNGAGKSTMIKILIGELIPDEGEIIKHPNVRIAYVAQHAFHHLEDHVEKTPNEYIQWRFAGGEDKEAQEKAARQCSPEEEKKMAEKFTHDGEKRQIERLLGRRQLKKSYEYEVKWVGKPHDQNSFLPKSKLEELGWAKIMQRIDEREAAQQGQYNRPLTQQAIVKHLEDVGLEPEYTVHTQIRALSGGQKVKVVIAAAMWNNPHLLVLDEPTNYLDRDSLGALAGAIREFGGGVLMISHHSEFTDALASEKWFVADGKVTPENQPPEFAQSEKLEWKPEEEMIDAGGNTIKIAQKKTNLSRKERQAREKNRKARQARGEEVSEDEDED